MKRNVALVALILSISVPIMRGQRVVEDHFDNLNNWIVEIELPGYARAVDNSLDIQASGGATIWYRDPIVAPCRIRYDLVVVDEGGPYDRVSDVNCFVMAADPKQDSFFTDPPKRNGLFTQYHPMYMYYVGYAANHNTTTRFRRYNGSMQRPLLPEHDLKGSMRGNERMCIDIEVRGHRFIYSVNGQEIFNYLDSLPLERGYFGFRTFESHQRITNFRVE